MTLRQEFLPAIGPYVTDPSKKWRHPIHWLDRLNESIYYPRFLASYALWRDEKNGFPFDRTGQVSFGDSGGYTLVTKGDSIDPLEVIRWQLKNCTRGVILDVPPYRPGSAIQFQGTAGEWMEDSILRTSRNIRQALPFYLAHVKQYVVRTQDEQRPFSWWGVVQGESREQMEKWHSAMKALYPFGDLEGEGWALAPKPSTDLLSCTRYMKFAHDKGLRKVHLLQVTAEKTVGLILALANLSGQFELVTYDSASALRCAINRSAIVPDGIGMGYIKESKVEGSALVDKICPTCNKLGFECHCNGNETTVTDYMRTCPCQACQWFREDYPLSNSEYPHYILLHNHIVMVESCDKIAAAATKDPDKVLRWVCGPLYGDVLREWAGGHGSQPKSQVKTVRLGERV